MDDNEIIQRMDDAQIPILVQSNTLLSYKKGGEDLRNYVADLSQSEPMGVCLCQCRSLRRDQNGTFTTQEARTLFWTLAKETILVGRRVMVINARDLVRQLMQDRNWNEDFHLDFYQHLFVTDFFRARQPSPYTGAEVARLTDYLGHRLQHGKVTHTFWEFASGNDYLQEAQEWFSDIWTQFWFEENVVFWSSPTQPTNTKGRTNGRR